MKLLPSFTGQPERNRIYHTDALTLLGAMSDESVDLIATDPPYFKVKSAAWDRQWESDDLYLEWLGGILKEYKRVLKPNGSLYIFASPRMAARVEVAVSEWFNVLNHIIWVKNDGWHKKAKEEVFRGYFPQTERIIFAEQKNSDDAAKEDGGYYSVYEEAKRTLKIDLISNYLQSEFDRAKVSRKEIAALFPSRTGGLTGCVSNWVLGYNMPTYEQYHKMRDYLNSLNGSEYLRKDYEELRKDYEELRKDYEELRKDYEELRRPFNVSEHVPYTDVWHFETVGTYKGKHECEKPLAMMHHIVETSSKPDGVVLDTFTGSGATMLAAKSTGRQYIGCDSSHHWARYGQRRLNGSIEYLPKRKREKLPISELPLFEGVI